MSYAAVSMGLFIFILAYFTFNAPKTVPKPEEPEVQISEFCEKVDPATAPTFKAPADNATKTGSEDDLSLGDPIFNPDCKADGPNHQFSRELTTYRLLMKNVPLTKTEEKHHSENFVGESCHFDTADELGIDISGIDTSEFKVFFPQISGEISLGRVHPSRTRGGEGEKTLMYFIDYGLVFFIHTKPDGTMTEVKGGTTQGASENFVLADIYQDIESPGRDGMPEEAFTCNTAKGAQIASGKQVLLPEQNISTDSGQLQLQYFVFGTGASSGQVVNGWGIHCKPAVYLYPPKKQLVNVRVNPKGELSYTDPPYDPLSGWTVNAFPSGQLLNIDNQQISNNYLYYESKLFDSEIKKPTKGWVVKFEDLEQLFNQTLPKLGLNQKEKQDFMDYWLKKLPKSPYYFVGLVDKSQRDYLETLEVTPNPETSIRFSLYFEALNEPKTVEEPKITTPDRKGFTLVDWGGMVKLHPGTPFTCSQ